MATPGARGVRAITVVPRPAACARERPSSGAHMSPSVYTRWHLERRGPAPAAAVATPPSGVSFLRKSKGVAWFRNSVRPKWR